MTATIPQDQSLPADVVERISLAVLADMTGQYIEYEHAGDVQIDGHVNMRRIVRIISAALKAETSAKAELPFSHLECTLATSRLNVKKGVAIFSWVNKVFTQGNVKVIIEIDGSSVEMVGRFTEQIDTPDSSYLKFSARKKEPRHD